MAMPLNRAYMQRIRSMICCHHREKYIITGNPLCNAVRMESAVTSGTEIHADFDPLIAKVIAHGENREDAISQMENALEQTVITGVRHNIPLIRAILADEDYRRNEVSTTYLQDRYRTVQSADFNPKEKN